MRRIGFQLTVRGTAITLPITTRIILGLPSVRHWSFPKIYNGRDKTTSCSCLMRGLYVDQQTPQTYQFVPQVCGPTGEGGVLAFLCNTAPAIPSPIAAMLTAFPYAEPAYSPTDQTALFQLPADGAAFPSHLNAASVRVDHNFSPRLSMFWRYGNTASDVDVPIERSSVTTHRATAQTLTFWNDLSICSNA